MKTITLAFIGILMTTAALPAFAGGASCALAHESTAKETSLDRLSTQIYNAYFRIDFDALKKALLKAGVDPEDAKYNPIYRGAADPQNISLEGVKAGKAILSAEIPIYTYFGKSLGTISLVTDGVKTKFQLLKDNEIVASRGMKLDYLQSQMRTAFLRSDENALRAQLKAAGVPDSKLQYRLITHGPDDFRDVQVSQFHRDAHGFKNARVDGVIEIYTYTADLVATVRMTTRIDAKGEPSETSFEILNK